jgi:pimeloyl-ACP methyl ester carboxylesterase
MEPIVLIHGYSAESKGSSPEEIEAIYGTLPRDLRQTFGAANVIEIDVSRYISLEDGVRIDDISLGLERALRLDFAHLLERRFHCIVHSTGALVARNWIRRHSSRPSPIKTLTYLAGANFGSGWGHVGQGQLAKWWRLVFEQGNERGLQCLEALELGAEWTLDLHLSFLDPAQQTFAAYQVMEFVAIGSYTDRDWFFMPIRYAKEDGSDGVVRVSGSNLNFNYIRFAPTADARSMDWGEVQAAVLDNRNRSRRPPPYYEIVERSRAGEAGRQTVPLAVLYETTHSGEKSGIVTGSKPRRMVLDLIRTVMEAEPDTYPALVREFQEITDATYERARKLERPLFSLEHDPRGQYDPHSQVIFRLRDQNGAPVRYYDVFFNSGEIDRRSIGKHPTLPVNKLFEDKHVNQRDKNIILFYLRSAQYESRKKRWVNRVEQVGDITFEITATEPETDEIAYLPLVHKIDGEALARWIVPHETTIIDVELLRVPSPKIFKIVKTK